MMSYRDPPPSYIGGREIRWGCLPRNSRTGDGTFPVYGEPREEQQRLIPRSEWDRWEDNNIGTQVWHVIDQGSQGSCTACATVGAGMVIRRISGLPRKVLSQAVPYALGNGGSDSGMAIDEGLYHLRETGTVPVDVIDQYDWRGYRQRRWPDNWREVAKGYRIAEAWDCPTYEHAISAVLCGFPVVIGVTWPGGGGHAIIIVQHKGKPRILNSWGLGWGNGDVEVGGGFGELEEDRCDRGIRTYGAWALRAMVHAG